MFELSNLHLLASGGGGDFDLLQMIRNLGPVGWVVVSLLLLMSMWSFGVMLDRVLMYAAVRQQSRVFVYQVAGALREGKLDEAIRIAERNKKSHIAQVTATGLAEFQSAPPRMNHERRLESAKRSLERSAAIVNAELERGLGSLATVGSTAPFVGLFGTVVGILEAFKRISTDKTAGISTVSGGISEALVTTALGLLVAVPAVWAFNYFSHRIKSFGVGMENSSAELVNYFAARLEGE